MARNANEIAGGTDKMDCPFLHQVAVCSVGETAYSTLPSKAGASEGRVANVPVRMSAGGIGGAKGVRKWVHLTCSNAY